MRLAVIALAAGLAAGPAAAAGLQCPRTLRTAQEAVDLPAGMTAEDGPHDWSRLSHVEFYAGAPVPAGPGLDPVRYALAPTSQAVQPRNVVVMRDFAEQRGEALFLGCHYLDTRIRLLLPLQAVARCRVTFGRSEAGLPLPGAVLGIVCE